MKRLSWLAIPLTLGATGAAARVDMVRTSYGIPHVTASDYTGLGYGQGYAEATDNLCVIAEYLVTLRGERSLYFGADGANAKNVGSDFFARYYYRDAARRLDGMSRDAVDLLRGYVAGYNQVASAPAPGSALACRDKPWVRPMTMDDAYRVIQARNALVTAGRRGPAILAATPPEKIGERLSPSVLAFADPGQADVGSNGWAFGADATGATSGLMLANPHFPWDGENRFYQIHLTIPGKIDVMGANLLAMPGVAIGFNRDVAWTHTVSYAARMTLFEVELVPGSPTRYRLDGRERDMVRVPVTIDVKRPDGTVGTRTHDFYETVHGPIYVDARSGITWGSAHAYAMGDVSIDNVDQIDTWLAFARARSVGEIRSAALRKLGIPWVNTLAADRHGDALYGDMSRIPNVPDAVASRCAPSAVGAALARRAEVTILAGNVVRCNWTTRPRVSGQALLPAAALPTTIRRDYVANANDSYWLPNARHPLSPTAAIVGEIAVAQGFRSRMQLDLIEKRLAGKGGQARTIDADWIRSTLFANRNYAAILARDATVALCRVGGSVRIDDRDVDLTEACRVIADWDGTASLDSRGSPLFREYWLRVADRPDIFAVPFDAHDPVATPRELAVDDPAVADALRTALGEAVLALRDNGFAIDAPLGAVQGVMRDGRRIGLPGGPGGQGVLNAMRNRGLSKQGYIPVHGTSYLQIVGFDARGPVPHGVLAYDQSTDPASPWFTVQTEMFARGEIYRFPFRPDEIRADPGYKVVTLPDDAVLHDDH